MPATTTDPSLRRSSPEELLRRSQRGELAARHALVGRYDNIIRATATRLAGPGQEADDLSTEIYLHLFSVIHRCKNVQTLPGWIKKIAVNEVYLRYRRHRRLSRHLSLETLLATVGEAALGTDLDQNPAHVVLEALQHHERRERLQQALSSLPEHHRDICERFYQQQHTCEEIVEETGLALGTVKSRLFRARGSLQRKLGDLIPPACGERPQRQETRPAPALLQGGSHR